MTHRVQCDRFILLQVCSGNMSYLFHPPFLGAITQWFSVKKMSHYWKRRASYHQTDNFNLGIQSPEFQKHKSMPSGPRCRPGSVLPFSLVTSGQLLQLPVPVSLLSGAIISTFSKGLQAVFSHFVSNSISNIELIFDKSLTLSLAQGLQESYLIISSMMNSLDIMLTNILYIFKIQ